jgi:hypothetical protein
VAAIAVTPPAHLTSRLEAATRARSTWIAAAFLAAHAPLALVLNRGVPPTTSTLHALAVLGFGLWAALTKRFDRVVMTIGYIVGAEVLWRMTRAQVNWEFGKYAAAAIMLVALLRHGHWRPRALPTLYFVLLVPSMFLTLTNEPWVTASDQISFNLSGPFALMVCAWFFSTVQLSTKDLRLLFLALVGPAISIATVAATGTFATADITFYDASNLAASGGFGPNQVSAALGLGALMALFVAMDGEATRILRLIAGVVVAGLATQAALTFSRGGLYMAGGAAAVAACLALRDNRLRSRLLPVAAALFIVGNYFVLPYLDAFTGGEMANRLQDTRLTGRDVLMQADIELWKENPLVGVGPGEGRLQRGQYFLTDGGATATADIGKAIAAHTEFSRVLAEHGALGLIALVCLFTAGVLNIWQAPDARSKAIVAGLIAWSILFMLSDAMRLLAPSLMFGVGFATFSVDHLDSATQRALTRQSRRQPGQLRRLVMGHPSLKGRSAPGATG